LPGCIHLWSPLLQLGVPPAHLTHICRPLRELSLTYSNFCLIVAAGPHTRLTRLGLIPSSDVGVLVVVRCNHLTQLPARLRAGLFPKWGTYLSPACTWLGLGVGLLPIGIVTPLLGSSLLHPGGGPRGNLLDLPAGSQRNGLCLGVGGRRLRFPTHGTWLRHLEQLSQIQIMGVINKIHEHAAIIYRNI